MSNQVFTLVLSSDVSVSNGGFMIDNTSRANVKYQVNFDSLFENVDKKYSKCQIRAQILSQNVASSAINNATGMLILSGLGQGNSLGINGMQLLTMSPSGAGASGVSTGYFYNVNSLVQTNGQQMTQIPKGTQNFAVQFMSIVDTLQASANIGAYKLLIQFELYDPIE